MAEKPSEETALRQSPSEGHNPKGLWVAERLSLAESFCISPPIKEMKMNIIHINSFGWWLIIFLNFVGYFILRFGIISEGTQKETIKAVGTLLTTISFILMLIFFGFLSSIALMLILWIVITPIVMILIKQLEKRLYPYRIKIRKEYANKLNVTEEEVERVNQMNDNDFWEEMRKKYTWLNNENR